MHTCGQWQWMKTFDGYLWLLLSIFTIFYYLIIRKTFWTMTFISATNYVLFPLQLMFESLLNSKWLFIYLKNYMLLLKHLVMRSFSMDMTVLPLTKHPKLRSATIFRVGGVTTSSVLLLQFDIEDERITYRHISTYYSD